MRFGREVLDPRNDTNPSLRRIKVPKPKGRFLREPASLCVRGAGRVVSAYSSAAATSAIISRIEMSPPPDRYQTSGLR